MGYIKFLKENEPSPKKDLIHGSKKLNKRRKIWKVLFIISLILNILLGIYITHKF